MNATTLDEIRAEIEGLVPHHEFWTHTDAARHLAAKTVSTPEQIAAAAYGLLTRMDAEFGLGSGEFVSKDVRLTIAAMRQGQPWLELGRWGALDGPPALSDGQPSASLATHRAIDAIAARWNEIAVPLGMTPFPGPWGQPLVCSA